MKLTKDESLGVKLACHPYWMKKNLEVVYGLDKETANTIVNNDFYNFFLETMDECEKLGMY